MIRLIAFISLFILCSAGYKDRYEKIKSFHSEVTVQKDGSVIVTEEIKVLALRERIKRGIYRDIPLNLMVFDERVRQDLVVISVEKDNIIEPYKTEMIKGGIRIMVGRKDIYLEKGYHVFKIKYKLDRTIFRGSGRAVLLWNVNGNHWDFYTDTLSAVINVSNDSKIKGYDAWTGEKGSKGNNYLAAIDSDSTVVFQSKLLNSNEGVTVQVEFDDAMLSEFSGTNEIGYFIRDNALLITVLLSVLITLLINSILWLKFGKDPKKGTIIPQFYPPEGWSPAEVSFLVNEGKEDDNTFAAQLLQLAVKGHIKIEKKGGKSKDDIFVISPTERSEEKVPLTELEQGFLRVLLAKQPYVIVRGKYNPRVAKANSFLIARIEKMQKDKYFRKNKNLILPQYLFPLASVVIMLVVMNYYEGPLWFIPISVILMIIMNVIFMKLFYQPTVKGRKMLDNLLGLKRFIQHADELRINATNKPDMNFEYFERNLPFAIAFGMSDEWGKQFDADKIEPPYKNSNYYMSGYTITNLAFIGALSTTTSLASIPPSSAGTSGGGFSGGGFSGGGAGGGGGGGW